MKAVSEHLTATRGNEHTKLSAEEQVSAAQKCLYATAQALVEEANAEPDAAIARRPGGGARIDVSAMPGRNGFERILSHLKGTDPSFVKLSWERQTQLAVAFRIQHRPVTGDQAYDAG